MKTLWEKLDAKMMTASGGILLAGFCIYILWKVLTNDLHDRQEREEKVVGALIQQALSNQEIAGAVKENTSVIKELKEVIRYEKTR